MEGVSDVGGKLLEDDFVSETVKLDGNSSFGCLGEASETTGGLVSLTTGSCNVKTSFDRS